MSFMCRQEWLLGRNRSEFLRTTDATFATAAKAEAHLAQEEVDQSRESHLEVSLSDSRRCGDAVPFQEWKN